MQKTCPVSVSEPVCEQYTDEISLSFNENCGLFTSKLNTYNHRRLKEILTTLAYQLIIFWPLIQSY